MRWIDSLVCKRLRERCWLDRSRPETLRPGDTFYVEPLVESVLYSSGTCTETAANYGTAMFFSTSKNDVKIYAITTHLAPSVKYHSRIISARAECNGEYFRTLSVTQSHRQWAYRSSTTPTDIA